MTTNAGTATAFARMTAIGTVRWRLALVGLLALIAVGWSGYLATVSLGWVKLGLCSSGSCAQLVLTSPWLCIDNFFIKLRILTNCSCVIQHFVEK